MFFTTDMDRVCNMLTSAKTNSDLDFEVEHDYIDGGVIFIHSKNHTVQVLFDARGRFENILVDENS